MRDVDDVPREVPLTGGNTPGVVRAGDTVRRPLNPGSARVHRLLAYFERCGFGGAPRFLGIDERGREILSFIDGFAPPHNGFELSEEGVRAGARLVRRVHDLTEGTEFAAESEIAYHPNLSQPNFIFRDMIPIAIIDWDGTRPGTRLANFAEFLWAFVHPAMYGDGAHAAGSGRRLPLVRAWPGRCHAGDRAPLLRDQPGVHRVGRTRARAHGAQPGPVSGTLAGLAAPEARQRRHDRPGQLANGCCRTSPQGGR